MRKYRKYLFLSIELLVAISLFISVEMLISKVGFILDLTPQLVHSLSARSRDMLDSLEHPLKIKH
jgi:diacylglycerol kinase